MSSTDDEGGVETTQLSLNILEFVAAQDGVRLREVKTALGIAKSTAHKHLTTLRKSGFLVKRGKTYNMGMKCLNFGERARRRWPGYTHIEDAISELTDRTEEDCDFVAPDRGRAITIAESYHKWVKYKGTSGDSAKTYRARMGSYYHMHATASGLAILSTYSRSRVDRIIDEWGLPARTEHTITTREELYQTLETIRQRGIAINNQGYTQGMRSIGRPVYGDQERVIGALSVSGPTYRIDGAVLDEEIPDALNHVGRKLEEAITSQD
jgi:DNA-binding IclR family transcriptional regulator